VRTSAMSIWKKADRIVVRPSLRLFSSGRIF
jgi:hypothetical protein